MPNAPRPARRTPPVRTRYRYCSYILRLASILCISTTPAAADTFELESFTPAIDSRGLLALNRSPVLGHGELSLGLVTTWAREPLTLQTGDERYRVAHVITPSLIAARGFAWSRVRFELGLRLPFRTASGDRDPNSDGGTPGDPNDDQNFSFSGQGLANAELSLKALLLDEARVGIGLSLVAALRLPRVGDAWMGDASWGGRLQLAADRSISAVTVSANLGVQASADAPRFVDRSPLPSAMSAGSLQGGSRVPLGLGVSSAALGPELGLEFFGSYGPKAEQASPIEGLVSSKFYLAERSYLQIGAGLGLADIGRGAPSFRGVVGIIFEPQRGDRDGDGLYDAIDRCPDAPEDRDDFEDADGCPDDDNDRDSVLDIDDDCPLVPENRNGIDDEDGCPEDSAGDRDVDGYLDHEDDCPDDAEDRDGFEDDDGCPDIDNDVDGILDIDDLCPDDPEDIDGFEDTDGCPDIDNDRDRIADEDDECPGRDGEALKDTQEVYNTVDDEDGCPDRGPVERTDGGFLLLEEIHFKTDSAEILPRSFGLLRAVAMSLQMHSDIERIEVQGHTDERGTRAYNLDLSQRRAESVRRFLIGEGVDAKRLQAQGYGEEVPKVEGHGPKAWAANRRVEFVILP